jgi:hypothetical protein
MMTIADLYDTARGTRSGGPLRSVNDGPRPDFYAMGEDTWRRDPRRNPMLAPANSDYEELAYNEQVQNLADELLKKNQANRSKQQVEMLRALLQQPNVNLFDKPTNPQEEAVQKIVQEHVNAGTRGVNLWFADTARRKKEAIDARNRAIQERKLAMEEAMFPINKARAIQQYQLGKTQQSDLNLYREDQVAAKAQGQQQQQRNQLEAQQQRDYNAALHLIEQEGANPNDLMDAFPNLSREHFLALDTAGKALANGQQKQFDEIKQLAQARTDAMNQKVSEAESDYLDRNQHDSHWYNPLSWFGGTVPEDVLMKRGQNAREEYLNGLKKDKAAQALRFDESTGSFVPLAEPPRGYTALDRALLARRRPMNPNTGGGYGGGYSSGPLPVPADGIPIARTPSELNIYSNYPSFRSTDGRVRRNPNYRPRAAAPPVNPEAGLDWTSGYGVSEPDYAAAAGDFYQ